MTIKELIKQLQQFPEEHEALVWIQFITEDGKEINMGEVCEIEDIFPNGQCIDIAIKSQAWGSAFDQAVIKEQFIDDDGNVTF